MVQDDDDDVAFIDIPGRAHLAPAEDPDDTPHKSISATANPIASQHSQHTHRTSASQKLRADDYRTMSERNVRDHCVREGVDSWFDCALDTPDDPRWSKAAAIRVCQELIRMEKIRTDRVSKKAIPPGVQLYTFRELKRVKVAGWHEWAKARLEKKENDKYSHISPMSEQICEAAQSVDPTLYDSDKRRALFKNTPHTGIKGVQVPVPGLVPDGQILLAESKLNDLLKHHGKSCGGKRRRPKIPSNKTGPCGGIFEFKLRLSDAPQNDRQILGGATLLLHNDPNRRFVLGITIEDTTVRIWRFDRGVILVSSSFDFEEEPEHFIRIMLYFSYANAVQLGFDPTVRPVSSPGQELNDFVYEINGRYFRTVGNPLSEDNASLVISRGVRVWKVRECDRNGNAIEGKVAKEGVLKEMWLYSDALSEKQIQTKILSILKAIDKQNPVAAGTKSRAKQMKKFFLKIVESEQVTINGTVDMTAVKSVGAKQIAFACDDEDADDMLPDIASATTSRRSARALPGSKAGKGAGFKVLQHHSRVHWRYLVEEECQTMYDLADLQVALSVGSDLAVALDLLRQAGYMHRDISGGNCMVYFNPKTRTHEAKLADLEFCKSYKSTTCHDPVTGTFQFMPVESRFRKLLLEPMVGRDDPDDLVRRKFHWHPYHDLESLYWVMIWYIFFYFPWPNKSNKRPDRDQWHNWRDTCSALFNSDDSTFHCRRDILLRPKPTLSDHLLHWGWDESTVNILSRVLSLGVEIVMVYQHIQKQPQNVNSKWPIDLFRGEVYEEFRNTLAEASKALGSGKVVAMNSLNPDLKRKRDSSTGRSAPRKKGKEAT